ncbi:MAG: hypothetical protein ABIO70_07745 [Pseudomonadota bacterium]
MVDRRRARLEQELTLRHGFVLLEADTIAARRAWLGVLREIAGASGRPLRVLPSVGDVAEVLLSAEAEEGTVWVLTADELQAPQERETWLLSLNTSRDRLAAQGGSIVLIADTGAISEIAQHAKDFWSWRAAVMVPEPEAEAPTAAGEAAPPEEDSDPFELRPRPLLPGQAAYNALGQTDPALVVGLSRWFVPPRGAPWWDRLVRIKRRIVLGESGHVVLCGPRGVGKSTLLWWVAEAVRGQRAPLSLRVGAQGGDTPAEQVAIGLLDVAITPSPGLRASQALENLRGLLSELGLAGAAAGDDRAWSERDLQPVHSWEAEEAATRVGRVRAALQGSEVVAGFANAVERSGLVLATASGAQPTGPQVAAENAQRLDEQIARVLRTLGDDAVQAGRLGLLLVVDGLDDLPRPRAEQLAAYIAACLPAWNDPPLILAGPPCLTFPGPVLQLDPREIPAAQVRAILTARLADDDVVLGDGALDSLDRFAGGLPSLALRLAREALLEADLEPRTLDEEEKGAGRPEIDTGAVDRAAHEIGGRWLRSLGAEDRKALDSLAFGLLMPKVADSLLAAGAALPLGDGAVLHPLLELALRYA